MELDRNLALEFVRVTEAGAMAAAQWFGKGDKNSADGAAVEAMRTRFNSIDFDGEIVIGEGEKDEAPMLYIGERIGSGKGPLVDIAIDPLECTANTASGKPNAMSVMAVGPKGTLLKAPGTYMDQLAVGPEAKGLIDIAEPLEDNLKAITEAKGKKIEDLTIAILDRERHREIIKRIRKLGCRIWLHDHGTIGAGLATCLEESPIDAMLGIGGAPEAVITAAGIKSMGGEIQGILRPHEKKYEKQAESMGLDKNQVFKIEDLAKGDDVMFVATGVSSGPLLRGVIFEDPRIITHSIVMRAKTGTVRFMKTIHRMDK